MFDFFEVQQLVPVKLKELSVNLYDFWDDHYPASRFPLSRLYKNAKIDTESNRAIHRQDFVRLAHVHDLHTTSLSNAVKEVWIWNGKLRQ